jgi:zinc transporter, ZIP family
MTILLLTSLAMLSTLAGGFIAVVARRRVHLLLGLGAGVVMGAVFFDLLPEALTLSEKLSWGNHSALGMVVLGFLTFYLAERLIVLHSCPSGDCTNEVHKQMGRFSASGLILHSALDGAAIGAAAMLGWRTGLLVAMAVVVHDASDGLNTILLVTHGEKAKKTDFAFLGLDAMAPLVGGQVARVIQPGSGALVTFLAVASGFFLYTATSDLLPEAHRRSPSFTVAASMVTGVAVMRLAVWLLPG